MLENGDYLPLQLEILKAKYFLVSLLIAIKLICNMLEFETSSDASQLVDVEI